MTAYRQPRRRQSSLSSPTGRRYALFDVVGLELEYAVVDRQLRPRPLVEPAFHALQGRPTSEVALGRATFSCEFAAHQFEVKTGRPQRRLAEAERILVQGIRRFSHVLHERFDARLLPTGMHPLMRPGDTGLWERSGREIYRTYARLFPVRTHGFLNVQASHVNLPFGRSEADVVALHNATACLLPYLPALAAASPAYEGRLGPFVDNRLAFYRTMQRRFPDVTGQVVPEFITSLAQYRRQVLDPIRRVLRRRPWTWRLRAEWVNSRGAILRFARRAIELRVLDVQECVRADVAIAAFVRGALAWLVPAIRAGQITLPAHRMLVADFNQTVRHGRAARVRAAHLHQGHGTIAARDALSTLLEHASRRVPRDERPYLQVVADRIEHGNLSERIARAVRRRARGRGQIQPVLREIYAELAERLLANRSWDG